MITWIKHFPVRPCKSLWRLQNPGTLPHQELITNFCRENSIQDCFITSVVPDSTHDMVSLVINHLEFVSIQHIDWMLEQCLPKARKFLHLAINKFLVYTEYNQELYVDQPDLDLKLIQHWSAHINRAPSIQQYQSNDCGMSGNFIYPITQVIWPIND